MTNVTKLLEAIAAGNPQAASELLPLLYDELRRLASQHLATENPAHTLNATALVHEAYLRLVGPDDTARWVNRRHFYCAAAEAMRRILVDHARRKNSQKRGGGWVRQPLPDLPGSAKSDPLDLIALNEALTQLEQKSPRKAELVKLRYFAGCTLPEIAEQLSISLSTAEDDWAYAKAWLRREMMHGEASSQQNLENLPGDSDSDFAC